MSKIHHLPSEDHKKLIQIEGQIAALAIEKRSLEKKIKLHQLTTISVTKATEKGQLTLHNY